MMDSDNLEMACTVATANAMNTIHYATETGAKKVDVSIYALLEAAFKLNCLKGGFTFNKSLMDDWVEDTFKSLTSWSHEEMNR